VTDSGRRRRIDDICDAALQLATADRARFISEACEGDEVLQREVESLLSGVSYTETFLATPIGAVAAEILSDQDASLAGRRVGTYEILSLAGKGGMGAVYRARDVRLKRDVALKVLLPEVSHHPERLTRFEREAQLVAALNHPNIAAIFGVEQADDITALVLEFVEGPTLADRIARGPIRLNEAIPIARQIAEALEAAHEQGIIHRDLKPTNIKVRTDGTVKVLDFGLAKVMEPVSSSSGGSVAGATAFDTAHSPSIVTTQAGLIVGTVAYMSPEQAKGMPVDRRCDIWAFGVVLFEMLSGRQLYKADTPTETLASVIEREPDLQGFPSSTPLSIRTLIARCLTKDPRNRLQAIGEARIALERASAERDVADWRVPTSPSDVNRGASLRRHRVALAGLATLFALVIVAAIYAALSRWLEPAIDSSFQNAQLLQLTTSGNAEQPAISPDGKYVAYVERSDTDYSIWIRQTGSTGNVRIFASPPRAQPAGVTVSPDGNFVDFVQYQFGDPDPVLWRTPFLGGPPRRLIDRIASPVGWSRDGRQLAFIRTVDSYSTSALVVAGSDGTGERNLAVRRVPAGFLSLSELGFPTIRPAWSPDGHLIALFGFDAEPGGRRLQVVFVDSNSGTGRIVPLPQGVGTPQGLAWLDGGSLVLSGAPAPGMTVQLFRMTFPGGQLSRLTNDLNDYTGISVTDDRDTLVTSRRETRASIWVGDRNGEGSAEVVPPTPFGGLPMGVAWLGDRVLYMLQVNGRISVAAINPGRGVASELVQSAGEAVATSDARAIVYVSAESGARTGIWKADADGRQPVHLVTGDAFLPVITPDDRSVVFLSRRSGVQSPWIVSLNGGAPTQLVNLFAGAYSVDVSPDGRLLAFGTVDEQNRYVTVVCDLPGCMNRRNVPPLPQGRLRWIPDSSAVAFISSTKPSNVWLQPLDGTAPRQLTHFKDGVISDFAWSHDGSRLAVADSTVTNDIVLFKALKR
jgi:eukaryotic-like serine/threonine-protein kinase